MKSISNIREEHQTTLKRLLKEKTGCTIQHDGWTCATCFFAIDKKLTNKDWQTVLLVRGDYDSSELNNLPKNIEARVKNIINIIK
jgi:hypothetical protein